MQTVCSYGDLIQPQKFSNTVRGPVCLRRRLFDGLFPRALFRFMFWFLHFLPTADCCRRCSEQRHGSWHCGMWQTGGVRGHGHLPGYGPRSKPFPLEFYSFIYLFFGERFYSAAVILLRFQALEAFVCCRCFDAQQHVVTPADLSLSDPHTSTLKAYTLHIVNATAMIKKTKKQKQTPVWFEKCDACVIQDWKGLHAD